MKTCCPHCGVKFATEELMLQHAAVCEQRPLGKVEHEGSMVYVSRMSDADKRDDGRVPVLVRDFTTNELVRVWFPKSIRDYMAAVGAGLSECTVTIRKVEGEYQLVFQEPVEIDITRYVGMRTEKSSCADCGSELVLLTPHDHTAGLPSFYLCPNGYVGMVGKRMLVPCRGR